MIKSTLPFSRILFSRTLSLSPEARARQVGMNTATKHLMLCYNPLNPKCCTAEEGN